MAVALFAAHPDPAPAQSQAELNDAVRAILMREGDDGTRPRHVIHFATPGTRAARPARVAEWLAANGFAVRTARDAIVFDHRTGVAGARFDRLTEALDTNLAKLGWSYEGWEAELLK